jgi:NifU-like protein
MRILAPAAESAKSRVQAAVPSLTLLPAITRDSRRMTPVEMLDDHQRRPRNLGKLAHANAIGDIGSIVVGDALRFYVAVTDGRISAAKFQVFNAQTMVASASAVTELAIGRTLAEAHALRPPDIARHLGDLDHALLPAQPWGLDGLHSACAALSGEPEQFDNPYDALLCRCYGISEQTVKQAIAVNDLRLVEAVTAATKAGSGCGSCTTDIKRMLDEATGAAPIPSVPAPGERKPEGRIPLLLKIQRVAEGEFLPALRQQGSDLELWDFDGRTVRARAKGRLMEQPAAASEKVAELQRLLRQQVSDQIIVALA